VDEVAQDGMPGGDRLHHEDLAVGTQYLFPARVLTEEEIAAFTDAYDASPAPGQERPGACAPSPAPYLATSRAPCLASPLHSCVLMMRMLCDGLLNATASLGSPGIDAVRWLRPVAAGEALRTRFTVQEKRDLASRPDVGISKVLVELLDAHGEPVTTWLTNQLVRRRRPGPVPNAPPRRTQPSLASLWDGAEPGAPPPCDAFFEDCSVGATSDFGGHTFAEAEIVAFARRFDPQPFHVDAASAKASLFGALCASGWHTAAVLTGKLARARASGSAEAHARGARLPTVGPTLAWLDVRWPRPVYVGDRIVYRTRICELSPAERPDRGLVTRTVQGRNQRQEIVLAFTSLDLLERRTPLAPRG
jgi:acyl dehydratase